MKGAPTDTRASSTESEDYYDKLGVTKIINAAGTYTSLTASIMPPSVQAAVARAAKHPVRLAELQKNSGEYLARKLKCEASSGLGGSGVSFDPRDGRVRHGRQQMPYSRHSKRSGAHEE